MVANAIPDDRPIYPLNQSFVVQIAESSPALPNSCAGKVEHLSSGRALCFANFTELTDFIRLTIEQPPSRAVGE
jgi:hypothetical protein